MQILGGHAVDVGGRDFLDFRLVLVEPVGRISVVLVGHALAENFVGRVEAEDEGVEDGVFGVLDFVVGDGLLGEVVDVFVGGLNRFDGALRSWCRSKSAECRDGRSCCQCQPPTP